MATPTSTVRAASLFNAFIPAANTPLIDKIHGLFGWTMACFAAGAVTCLYSLYQAYQFSTHSSFGLDDKFKLVKCNALLLEADGKQATANIQHLLQQCEALLASITDTFHSHAKEELLVNLAQHYAKTDPEHAYSIAQRLTSFGNLFNAAQSIQKQHPDFDKTKLASLYQRANEAREQACSNLKMPLEDLLWALQLTTVYFTLDNHAATETYNEKAQKLKDSYFNNDPTLSTTFTSPLTQMRKLCSIAQSFHEIRKNHADAFFDSAKKLMAEMPDEDFIEAHLVLADAYLGVKNFKAMDQELQAVIKRFNANNATIHKNLYSFAKRIQKITTDDTVESVYKNVQVETLINIALDHISKLDGKEQAEAYNKLAGLYQEGLVAGEYLENTRDIIYKVINALPESSETEKTSKIDLLCNFIYYYRNDIEAKQDIQTFYEQCPVEKTSPENYDKAGFEQKIIQLYNTIGLAADSEPFFQNHISDIISHKDTKAFGKITKLACYGERSAFNTAQKKAALEAAEQLLPQLSRNEQSLALAQIAKGYLQVDRQRSLNILADLEDRQAKNYKALAFVTAVATASMYFYPTVAPVLFLGAGVLRLYPSLISAVY